MSPRSCLFALAVLAGCSTSRPAPQPWTHAGPSRVLEVLVRNQCAACHSVESVFGAASEAGEPLEETEGCTRARDASEDQGFCHVPALTSMERFRAGWLRSFLSAPSDLRPHLAETMPPHALTPAEVDLLLSGWGAQPEVAPPPAPARAQLAHGAALFEQKQCGACHQLGGRQLAAGPAPTERQRALAPDLRHARLRLSHSTLERFIHQPAAVQPTSRMQRIALTADEARALADFIYFAPLAVSAEEPPRSSRPDSRDEGA